MPPTIVGTFFWNGPKSWSATFVRKIATANVVMNVIISKSTSLRRLDQRLHGHQLGRSVPSDEGRDERQEDRDGRVDPGVTIAPQPT